ncbi:MAG: iron chelate uptake ABC transporter family permease subunit [Chloracidobacterium sp.]|nr:iron chelate uptake ABC transporter family permease subunit [Chloracidobacterium sp.]
MPNEAVNAGPDPLPAAGRWNSSRLAFFATVPLLLVFSIVAGVAFGSSTIAPETVVRVLAFQLLPAGWVDNSQFSEANQVIVWLVRVPRVLVGALVGASLGLAGAQMQGLFRNALASPDIIGSSSGGALGAVLALATGLATRSLFYLPVFAFVGALSALFLVYSIATRRGRTPVATLLLAGIAVNALVGAASSFLISMRWVRYEVAQEILFWLMGGLDNRTWDHFWLVLPTTLIGLGVALLYARDLDVLSLGEENALSVGTDVEKIKRILIASSALLTGGAVAVSGTVGFVGLVVPHIVRLLIGPRHRYLLPASALAGAAFLIFADIVARTIQRPEEIRLGIITAVFGAPFFLFLLLRQQRNVGIG